MLVAPPKQPTLITYKEARTILDITRRAGDKLLRNGDIERITIGKTKWCVKNQVEDLRRRRTVNAIKATSSSNEIAEVRLEIRKIWGAIKELRQQRENSSAFDPRDY